MARGTTRTPKSAEGGAFVYYGSSGGLGTTIGWHAESGQAGARLGYAVGTAGDVNGDGYDDVIVGAGWYGSGLEGRVYVHYGAAGGLSGAPDWVGSGEQSSSIYGWDVATAGDVNGDGYDEAIVGAYAYSDTRGRAYVYAGGGPIFGLKAINSSPTFLGSTTYLTATHMSGTATWAFGDGAFGNGIAVAHIYPNVGTYTAVVTASNAFNTVSASTPVTITPNIPIAGLSATNSSPTWLGSLTTLTATVAAGSSVVCVWDFGDSTPVATGRSASHIYGAKGSYQATVTATNSVSLVTATTPVTIVDAPIIGLSVLNDSPTLLGHPTAFTAALDSGTNVRYSWAFGDGHFASGVNGSATHTYSSLGTYTAVVTATNSSNQSSAPTSLAVVGHMAVVYPHQVSGLTSSVTGGVTVTIWIQPGAVAEPVTLVLNPATGILPPHGLRFADAGFTLDVYRDGVLVPDFQFYGGYTVEIHYPTGLNADGLLVAYWDGAHWLDVAGTCVPYSMYDRWPEEHWFSIDSCHLSKFALFEKLVETYLPYIICGK